MSKNLFQIADEYYQYLSLLEQYFEENPEVGGEMPDEIEDRLNINRNEMAEKLDAYNYYILKLKGEIEMLEARIDQLKSKAKSKEKTIDRLKEYMAIAITTYGEIDSKSKAKKPSIVFKTIENKFSFINREKIEYNIDKLPYSYILKEIKAKLTVKEEQKLMLLLEKEPELVNKLVHDKYEIIPNKELIKEELEKEVEIPGVEIIETGYVKIS